MRHSRGLTLFWGLLLAVWLWPSPALAYISHWDPTEAFFIRQVAYLVFALAMLFFAYELKLESLQEHPGFRKLIWASIFFALWNLNCGIGQFLALTLDTRVMESPGSPGVLPLDSWGAWVYYLTKFDHLWLVPAFFFLYRGIRSFGREGKADMP